MNKPNLLFVDYYEFTSGRVNLDFKRNNEITESFFFRRNLKGYQYLLAVGQHHLIDFIMEMNEGQLPERLIKWLEDTGGGDLNEEFLDYLADFNFDGEVTGVDVGTPVFPNEPVINVTGKSIDVQLIETYLLHAMNTQSPVATTASMLRAISGKRSVVDFGARRSFNPMLTAEAAIIGGADATSLVQAAQEYGLDYVGTMPHKFIQERWDGQMTFSASELIAFREYAETYPHNTVLLVDTYNTMNGILNAIIVARELRQKGFELKGIRLDSGDLLELSKMARALLNAAGFHNVRIYVSDNIDPWKIRDLLAKGAPIDGFGVGTRLVHPHEALGGVYKLVQAGDIPYMKFTDNPKKMTLPYKRNIWRKYDVRGFAVNDMQTLWNEQPEEEGYTSLHHIFVAGGTQVYTFPSVKVMKKNVLSHLRTMKPILKRTFGTTNMQPAPYRVELSKGVEAGKKELISRYETEFGKLNKKKWDDSDWKERIGNMIDNMEDYLYYSTQPVVFVAQRPNDPEERLNSSKDEESS